MCRNCAPSFAVASWTAAGEISRADRLRGRELRVRVLRNLLAQRGLRVEASALGSAMRLTAADGTTLLAEDAAEIWPWIESVLGAAWDPLGAGDVAPLPANPPEGAALDPSSP